MTTNKAQVITVTGTRDEIIAALFPKEAAPKTVTRKTRPLSKGTLRALKDAGKLPAGWSVKEVLAGTRTIPTTGEVQVLTAAQRKVAAQYHAPTGAVRAIVRASKKG